MTVVSGDPPWWPDMNAYLFATYFGVAALVVVAYDWALTFGQEVELIWRQRLSPMTVMYLGVRYLGILYATLSMLWNVPTTSLTDTECFIVYVVWNWICAVAFAMLWVITITRLHAMYQRSRKILIFLIVTFLAVNIFSVMVAVMITMHSSAEELILSGTYQCSFTYPEYILLLSSITWILVTVLEVLALCLAVWITVKHFRELRRHSAGGIIGDCFEVLLRSHVLYFASFVVTACFELISDFSPMIVQYFQIFGGLFRILEVVQMFILGPRLILSLREYHAELVANSDAATCMTSIAFQDRVHISTGNGV